jgi:hypothetical protein
VKLWSQAGCKRTSWYIEPVSDVHFTPDSSINRLPTIQEEPVELRRARNIPEVGNMSQPDEFRRAVIRPQLQKVESELYSSILTGRNR